MGNRKKFIKRLFVTGNPKEDIAFVTCNAVAITWLVLAVARAIS